MNCRDAERQIFAERDGALESSQRAALAEHVAQCAACRQTRNVLSAAISSWRSSTQAAPMPDPTREWEALRREIRGGIPAVAQATQRRNLVPWLALPVGAAAALAVVLMTNQPAPVPAPARQIAKTEAVEVSAGDGSVVYVDDKSGWVVVWEGDSQRM